jgi:hypothetical protein
MMPASVFGFMVLHAVRGGHAASRMLQPIAFGRALASSGTPAAAVREGRGLCDVLFQGPQLDTFDFGSAALIFVLAMFQAFSWLDIRHRARRGRSPQGALIRIPRFVQ